MNLLPFRAIFKYYETTFFSLEIKLQETFSKLLGQEYRNNQNMKIKAGIIGLGVGEQHIFGYNQHPECEVVALCDFSPEKLKDVQSRHPNIKIVDNAKKILEDPEINVVSIASYDNYHYEQILMAIDNGKHIFVEKPLCLFAEEAQTIREKLDNTKLKISSNLILRLSPRFQYVKTMLEQNQFGDIYYFESDYQYGRIQKLTEGWRGEIDFYSVVYGGGVHMVDLLLWLTNDTIEEVSSYGNNICTRNTPFKYNDMIVSILQFKSGAIAKVACNFGCVKPHFHSLSIFGTKATFVNGHKYAELFTNRNMNSKPKKITQEYPGIKKGDLLFNFIESILKNTHAIVCEEDIFKTMSVCFAIEKSVKTRNKVKVNYI